MRNIHVQREKRTINTNISRKLEVTRNPSDT